MQTETERFGPSDPQRPGILMQVTNDVLVGTTAGVASRIVPFDYLVVNLTHHTLTTLTLTLALQP